MPGSVLGTDDAPGSKKVTVLDLVEFTLWEGRQTLNTHVLPICSMSVIMDVGERIK